MTRRQMLTALFGAAVLTLPIAGCGHQPVQDEPGAELILRYAENQPEDYPTTQAALAFADLVAQRTDGRVKVLVYSGGELGAEQSVIQQMQFGGVDFSRVSLSQLAEYEPELSVLQLPYLYSDAQQMWRVLDGGIGDEFLAMLDGMDLVGLSWFDAGVRSFYTREKVTGLDDLQGLTIRVQESDMMSDMITALGAKPAQVVYSKVYAALHNAEIDGAENNWPSYEVMGHYEVAPLFPEGRTHPGAGGAAGQPGGDGKACRAGRELPGGDPCLRPGRAHRQSGSSGHGGRRTQSRICASGASASPSWTRPKKPASAQRCSPCTMASLPSRN